MARDPETRKQSRYAQNLRRKLQRRAVRLRKIAAKEKNAKISEAYVREAKNLEAAVKRSYFSKSVKTVEKIEAVTSKFSDKSQKINDKVVAATSKFSDKAQKINDSIARKTLSFGEKLKKVQALEEYVSQPTKQKHRNIFVQNEMRRALDNQNTIFGSGQEGRAKVRAFYMAFSDDWVSKEGDTLTNILQAHPGMDIYDLYKSIFLEKGSTGKTWEEFIADYLGIDYSNIDTSSPAFKNQMNEEFDKLDSPIQKELAVQYNNLH